MSGQHTPGPWRVDGPSEDWKSGISGPSGNAVVWVSEMGCDCGIDNDADTRRIVAAVNACEGISTEALGAGVVDRMATALEQLLLAYEECNGTEHYAYQDAAAALAERRS